MIDKINKIYQVEITRVKHSHKAKQISPQLEQSTVPQPLRISNKVSNIQSQQLLQLIARPIGVQYLRQKRSIAIQLSANH